MDGPPALYVRPGRFDRVYRVYAHHLERIRPAHRPTGAYVYRRPALGVTWILSISTDARWSSSTSGYSC